MRKDAGSIKEDIMATSVTNIQGLENDPIGLRSKTAKRYKGKNKMTTLKKLKETSLKNKEAE